VKFIVLAQNSQVDPAVSLKIPIRALELAKILGQPPVNFRFGWRTMNSAHCSSWLCAICGLMPPYKLYWAKQKATSFQ
jgi:hypothetical protein